MAIEDRNLTVGARLVASYRKQAHVCMVEKAEEGDGILFVLEDDRKFKSPSSAASAVMGGKAVNGWRFWSVQGTEPKAIHGGEKPETQAAKPKRLVYRVPNQKGIAEGQSRWFCRACLKGFVIGGDRQPEACPAGHRGDDPERTAAVGPAEETSAEARAMPGDEAPAGACLGHGVCNGLRTQKASMRKAT